MNDRLRATERSHDRSGSHSLRCHDVDADERADAGKPVLSAVSESFHGYETRTIAVDVASSRYDLVAPACTETLLDSDDVISRFETDEYLPYWADLWPTALLLARRVRGEPVAGDDDATLLEIGCGLGLVAIAAAHAGWSALATDYDADAIAFAAENARRNDARITTALVDWRATRLDRRFRRIVASDVLYEKRNHEPIAGFLLHHLDDDGEAWIGDSFRPTADPAIDTLRARGFTVDIDEEHGHRLDGEAAAIRILRCRRARST